MYTTFQKICRRIPRHVRSRFLWRWRVCADRYLQSSGGIGLLGIALAMALPSPSWSLPSATSPAVILIPP